MSAFLVSDDHIRLIAQAQAVYGDSVEDLDELCTMLYRENVNSINARYPGRWNDDGSFVEPYPIEYHPVFGGEDPANFKAIALKQIHCYQYQSCEHSAWRESEAKRLTDELEAAILATITKRLPRLRYCDGDCRVDHPAGYRYCPDFFELPGYERAPWGWEGDSIAA